MTFKLVVVVIRGRAKSRTPSKHTPRKGLVCYHCLQKAPEHLCKAVLSIEGGMGRKGLFIKWGGWGLSPKTSYEMDSVNFSCYNVIYSVQMQKHLKIISGHFNDRRAGNSFGLQWEKKAPGQSQNQSCIGTQAPLPEERKCTHFGVHFPFAT